MHLWREDSFLEIYFSHLHKKSLESSSEFLADPGRSFVKSRKQFQGLKNLIDWDPWIQPTTLVVDCFFGWNQSGLTSDIDNKIMQTSLVCREPYL